MDEKEKIKDLFRRYIYEVSRRLPPRKREETARELQILLDDMLEDRVQGTPSEADAQALLLEMGPPKQLAERYREKKRYLIGPNYYEQYVMLLVIWELTAFLGLSAAYTLQAFLYIPENITRYIQQAAWMILSTMVWGFAAITLLLSFVERYSDRRNISMWEKDFWNPGDLPPAPKETIYVSRAMIGFEMTCLFLILLILNFFPWIVGIYIRDNTGLVVVPLFREEAISGYLLLLDATLGIEIIKRITLLLSGRYSLKVSIASICMNLICMVLFVAVFADRAVWNDAFFEYFSQFLGQFFHTEFSISFDLAQMIFVGILIFLYTLESGMILYRGLRAKTYQEAG